MKSLAATSIALLALFDVNSAISGGFSSPAYIDQVSYGSYSGSFPSISTADIVKPMFKVATAISALKPSQGNLGLVWQDGDNNNASIVQNGSGNVGLIRQIGLDNTASIQQDGSGHAAMVYQQGRGNVAVIRQR